MIQSGLLEMQISDKVEPNQMQVISDMVNFCVKNFTYAHDRNRAILFFVAHVSPQLIQMFIANDPEAENFGSGAKDIIVYLMLSVSAISQLIIFKGEIDSFRGAEDWFDNFSQQNSIDIVSIVYTFVYIGLRITMPSSAHIRQDSIFES
jgi:hypothetical protein